MGWAAGGETPRGGVLRLAERALFLRPAVARVAEDALARFALSLALVDGLVERHTRRSSPLVPMIAVPRTMRLSRGLMLFETQMRASLRATVLGEARVL